MTTAISATPWGCQRDDQNTAQFLVWAVARTPSEGFLLSLIQLIVDDLRCLQHAELMLDPRRNLIWGSNGSGKTSLLEAIFLLGRGRSFRTRNSEKLIRHGQPRLTVFGRVDGGGARSNAVGVQ